MHENEYKLKINCLFNMFQFIEKYIEKENKFKDKIENIKFLESITIEEILKKLRDPLFLK